VLAGSKNTGYILQGYRDKFAGLKSSDFCFSSASHLRAEANDIAEKVVVNV